MYLRGSKLVSAGKAAPKCTFGTAFSRIVRIDFHIDL